MEVRNSTKSHRGGGDSLHSLGVYATLRIKNEADFHGKLGLNRNGPLWKAALRGFVIKTTKQIREQAKRGTGATDSGWERTGSPPKQGTKDHSR